MIWLAGKLPHIDSVTVSKRNETGTLQALRKSEIDDKDLSALKSIDGVSTIKIAVSCEGDHGISKATRFTVGKIGHTTVWSQIHDEPADGSNTCSLSVFRSDDDEALGPLLYNTQGRPLIEKKPLGTMVAMSSKFERKVVEGSLLSCLMDERNKEMLKQGMVQLIISFKRC